MDCKFLKTRNKDRDGPKYSTKYYKRKFIEVNILEKEDTHQKSKHLKYKNLNKDFSKKKTRKEDTGIIDDTSDSVSSSNSEAQKSRGEDKEASIAYDSESGNDDENSNNFIGREENNWNNGWRNGLIINKLKNNSKSNTKEHTLSSNNLDKAINDAHLLNTLQKPTK